MQFKYLRPKILKHPNLEYNLEYLEKENGVAALIVDFDFSSILLVKQFRAGVNRELYEIPAGILEYGILPEDGMKIEVEEETGYQYNELEKIFEISSPIPVSPSYTEEKLHLFFYKLRKNEVVQNSLNLDDGELLTTEWVRLDQIENIDTDLKTLFAYNVFKLKFLKGENS